MMQAEKGDDAGKTTVAYFSMEIGITHKIPSYSGGLGILAGDTLKAFADIGFPVVGVTLLNEKGYFYQHIDSEGRQVEDAVRWRPDDFMVQLPNIITVPIEDRQVKIRAWKHLLHGISAKIPIIFLDSNVEGNSDYDKDLTSVLYGGDRAYRLCQEIILGIGGIRMLESLGYHNISKYHMNEGHAALLTVELLKRNCTNCASENCCGIIEQVRAKCVFTTHTPVAAGHDRFDIDLFRKLTRDYVPDFIIKKVSDGNQINMTLFGLTLSKYVNGVAERHGEITREMFPGYNIDSITNGVHALTWASQPFRELFDRYIPGWTRDATSLRYALSIHRHEIWRAHERAKQFLIDEVNQRTNVGFDNEVFTIGFARRFTAYKRPDLLIIDIERLKAIAEKFPGVQVVFAGKAHQQDYQGKDIIQKVWKACADVNRQNSKLKMAFVEHYDMKLAKEMVSGSDVWLNTPQRPYEASGTSGMKAAINGVPHFSTLDGWWLEGHIENITGWSIGAHPQDADFKEDSDAWKDADDMYQKLEAVILPMYYGAPDKWQQVMRYCIANNGSFFNTHRMANQYIMHAYQLA